MFISDFTIGKNKKRVVHWSGKVTTNETQIRGTDLRTLERKGLLTFELSRMTDLFGVKFWDVVATEACKEELEDEYARRCAEADAENAALEAALPEVDDVDEQRSDRDAKAIARQAQRSGRVIR